MSSAQKGQNNRPFVDNDNDDGDGYGLGRGERSPLRNDGEEDYDEFSDLDNQRPKAPAKNTFTPATKPQRAVTGHLQVPQGQGQHRHASSPYQTSSGRTVPMKQLGRYAESTATASTDPLQKDSLPQQTNVTSHGRHNQQQPHGIFTKPQGQTMGNTQQGQGQFMPQGHGQFMPHGSQGQFVPQGYYQGRGVMPPPPALRGRGRGAMPPPHNFRGRGAMSPQVRGRGRGAMPPPPQKQQQHLRKQQSRNLLRDTQSIAGGTEDSLDAGLDDLLVQVQHLGQQDNSKQKGVPTTLPAVTSSSTSQTPRTNVRSPTPVAATGSITARTTSHASAGGRDPRMGQTSHTSYTNYSEQDEHSAFGLEAAFSTNIADETQSHYGSHSHSGGGNQSQSRSQSGGGNQSQSQLRSGTQQYGSSAYGGDVAQGSQGWFPQPGWPHQGGGEYQYDQHGNLYDAYGNPCDEYGYPYGGPQHGAPQHGGHFQHGAPQHSGRPQHGSQSQHGHPQHGHPQHGGLQHGGQSLPPQTPGGSRQSGSRDQGNNRFGAPVINDPNQRPLEERFPKHFFTPSRANLMSLKESGAPSRMEYDPIDTDVNESEATIMQSVPREETKEVINEIHRQMRWCMFVYHSNWFASWVVKQAVPGIDTRMSKFRRLRVYAKGTYKSQKNKFLWDKLHAYFLTMSKDYPQLLEFDYDDDSDDRQTFEELVEPWINAYFFQEVFAYIAPYINYQATFGDKEDLPFFFLKSVVIDLGIMACRVIKSEKELNRGRGPGTGLAKKKDENARAEYRAMFDSLAFHQSFIEVDREIFNEIPLELVIPRVTRNNVDLEILERSVTRNPPPRRRDRAAPTGAQDPWRPMPSYAPEASSQSSGGRHGSGGRSGGGGQGSGPRRVSGPGSATDSPRDRGSPYERPRNDRRNDRRDDRRDDRRAGDNSGSRSQLHFTPTEGDSSSQRQNVMPQRQVPINRGRNDDGDDDDLPNRRRNRQGRDRRTMSLTADIPMSRHERGSRPDNTVNVTPHVPRRNRKPAPSSATLDSATLEEGMDSLHL